MSVDTLDPCGVYFGTTGGQVYGSANAGDSWTAIVRDLPPVLSVEVQTLSDPRALPQHLQTLARVGAEVEVEVPGAATHRAVLDALESRYPVLRGTIRDQSTFKRRAFVRFLRVRRGPVARSAGHPAAGSRRRGGEPFLIIGALAGG